MVHAASVAFASAFALALTAGCGSTKNTPKPSATSAATSPSSAKAPAGTSAAAPLSESELKARLLTVEDLPAGFSVDADNTDTNGKISSSDAHCRPLVDLMNADGKPPGATATVDASFTRSELGPNIATGLAGFPSVPAAQSLLESVTTAMKTCSTLTETDKDGGSYDFGVAPLAFPASGDASGATRMSADIGGYPAQIDIVLSRIGSTLLYVANTGLGGTDSQLTQEVVAKAVAKVQAPESPAASG